MIGGELVREARKRAALSQRELAERAGTTQSAIARVESGRTRPAFEDVERLMRLCGFQLIVELAPYDDSDLVQAKQRLRLNVNGRVAALEAAHRSAAELRKAMVDARSS